MSADDKKAKRLEQSIKRKARKDRQREDAAWQQLMDDYWCDNNRDSDERWADALDRVEQYRDARGVLVMMVALGLGPDWVRERLTLLLNDKLPPLPPGDPLSDDDKRLVAADRELREKMSARPTGNYAQLLDDMARKYNVEQDPLDDFHNRRGGMFERIERQLVWERAYLPSDEQ